MLSKLVAKIGQKSAIVLSALFTAAVAGLYHTIRVYFLKKKYFEKGRKAEQKLWESQQHVWENKIEKIKEDSTKTIQEKIAEIQELEKQFKEYIKKTNKNANKKK